MLEQILVFHCAPTLAGLKSGSLFCLHYKEFSEIQLYLTYWNDLLNRKGVTLKILRISKDNVLIYVYRHAKIVKDLENKHIKTFLEQLGYNCNNIDLMLEHLSSRIVSQNEFPHEIGLFLGYPFEDVIGFIENKGQNHKCVGCWKVYSNEETARNRFALYKKCKEVYRKKLSEGKSILQLTV
ncbi:MAG: DUF3793 family protein [Anaerotignaceae bacterium]